MFYIMKHNLHPCSIVITLESTIYQKDITRLRISLIANSHCIAFSLTGIPAKDSLQWKHICDNHGMALDVLTSA